MEMPCCAHVTLNYQTETVNGLTSGWWECKDCKGRFFLSPIFGNKAVSAGSTVKVELPEPQANINGNGERDRIPRNLLAAISESTRLLLMARIPLDDPLLLAAYDAQMRFRSIWLELEKELPR
jgi:hypothetical protein